MRVVEGTAWQKHPARLIAVSRRGFLIKYFVFAIYRHISSMHAYECNVVP